MVDYDTINYASIPFKSLGLPTRWWGKDAPLFNVLDSFKFIEYCELNNISILGAEGFRCSENARIPDMKYIFDSSNLYTSDRDSFYKNSTQMFRKFLQEECRNSDIEFEFVLVKRRTNAH